MRCFWKKSSSGPCACAYRLNAPADVILARLGTLPGMTLVMRQQGLSLMKRTPFGTLKLQQARSLLRDRLSGVECDLSGDAIFHLLTDASDSRPQLVCNKPGLPVDFSIRLDGQTWDSPQICDLIRSCDAIHVACETARHLGAGAWLDEWNESPPTECDHILARAARRQIESCRILEVRVKTTAHGCKTRFLPSFIDEDGGILRIADKHCRHVVYADADSPGFLMDWRSARTLSISQFPSVA